MLSLPVDVEALLDAVPDALVGVNRAGIIRFVNRGTAQLFGYQADDLVGLPVEVLVPESLRPAHRVHRERYNAAPQARGMGLDLKLHGRRRDGTQFPVDIALSHLDTPEGLLVVAAVRDMTDRQKASHERDRMNRLLAVIEFSSQAIISITLGAVITSWNPAAARLFGYQSPEIVGRSFTLLSPRDHREETAAILTQVRAGKAVEDLETVGVTKGGRVFPVSVTVSPIYDQGGALIGASAMPRDLTSAQNAVTSARSMIESSLDSLVAINPEGKITDVNRATVKITGVPREELIGTSFSTYFTDPEKADKIYMLAMKEGAALDYPLTIRHRDGTLTEVRYNASVHRDAAGRVLGVFAAARDVTKQMQAQREIAEQLAREQARLGELERFHRMTIDRGLKVIELEKEIETLRGPEHSDRDDSDDRW